MKARERDRRTDLHNTYDTGGEKRDGVAGQAEGVEDGGGIVQDRINLRDRRSTTHTSTGRIDHPLRSIAGRTSSWVEYCVRKWQAHHDNCTYKVPTAVR